MSMAYRQTGIFETIVQSISLALCLTAGIITVKNNLPGFKRLAHVSKLGSPPLGGQLLKLPTERANASNFTLVAVLSTHCGFCTRSLPLYKTLLASRSSMDDFQFVAMFKEGMAQGQQYLRTQGVNVDQVLPQSLVVDGTPTLLLVRNRKIEDVLVGYLDESGEGAVSNRIKSLCPNCSTTVFE